MTTLDSAELQKQLDATINQRLAHAFSDGESKDIRPSVSGKAADISNFARFLTQALCLENLLFWKEVRDASPARLPQLLPEQLASAAARFPRGASVGYARDQLPPSVACPPQVEQYKTLFTAKERAAVGSKIYEMYIKSDSQRKVNLKEEHVNAISKGMEEKVLAEDLFDQVRLPRQASTPRPPLPARCYSTVLAAATCRAHLIRWPAAESGCERCVSCG